MGQSNNLASFWFYHPRIIKKDQPNPGRTNFTAKNYIKSAARFKKLLWWIYLGICKKKAVTDKINVLKAILETFI